MDAGCDEFYQCRDTDTHTRARVHTCIHTAIGNTCSLPTKNVSIHPDVVTTGCRKQQPVYSLALRGVFLRRKRKAVHKCFHIWPHANDLKLFFKWGSKISSSRMYVLLFDVLLSQDYYQTEVWLNWNPHIRIYFGLLNPSFVLDYPWCSFIASTFIPGALCLSTLASE